MSLATPSTPTYQFDEATATHLLGKTELGLTCYTGEASVKWAIGNVPNVVTATKSYPLLGYVVSLMLDSVMQHYQQRHQKHPIALNCFFFGKTLPGPCIVEIEELKASGKGYCICRAVLKQYKNMDQALPTTIDAYKSDGLIDKVHGIFTMGNMTTEKGRNHFHNSPKPPSRKDMVPYKYMFMSDYVTAYVDPSTFPRSGETGEPILKRSVADTATVDVPGKPELSQSMAFSDGRPVDLKSMAYWVDMILPPPALLGSTFWGGPIWCPTMQLEIQFKRIPDTKEVLCHFHVPHVINNRFDLDGEVFDSDGNILAVTRHQCLVVDWSRNSGSKI